MSNPLMNIPGLAGYLAQQQGARQQEQGQLQEFGQVMGIRQALQQQADADGLKKALAASGGDVEKAMAAAIQSGNLAGAAQLAPIVEARRKGTQGQPIGAGGLRMPDGTIVPPADKPKEFAPPELIKLHEMRKQYLGAGATEDSPVIKDIDARISKLNTPPAGVTVNMPGSSDTVQGQDGRFYKFQVGKDGQVRAVPIQTTSGEALRPPLTPSEVKANATAAEDQLTVDSVRRRIESMTQKIQSNTGIVGPAGLVRRMGETVGGMASPDLPTPALDYQNEMRLLLSDVRKMVEKDPNLSKDEREALYETLGGGVMQTPGSAIRTLTNILNKVENAKLTSIGKNKGIEAVVKEAGWIYQPDKYEYRVIDGKVQRRAK